MLLIIKHVFTNNMDIVFKLILRVKIYYFQRDKMKNRKNHKKK